MSDLSRLLGDVYQAETASEPPTETTTNPPAETASEASAEVPPVRLPEWADDDVLDKAFASWVPGPPEDAPAAERGMLTDLAADPTPAAMNDGVASPAPAVPAADHGDPAPVPVADDEHAAFGPATHTGTSEPAAGPLAAAPYPVSTDWQRADDDILVRSGRRSRFRRSR